MSQDWNWNGQEELQCTVVPRVHAVAVYANEMGEVVIRQQGEMGEDDSVVVLPVSAAKELILALQNEIDKPFTPG